jgi:hypothetical protein
LLKTLYSIYMGTAKAKWRTIMDAIGVALFSFNGSIRRTFKVKVLDIKVFN